MDHHYVVKHEIYPQELANIEVKVEYHPVDQEPHQNCMEPGMSNYNRKTPSGEKPFHCDHCGDKAQLRRHFLKGHKSFRPCQNLFATDRTYRYGDICSLATNKL